MARYVPLVGAAPAAVVVRDLGKRRWGVCDHRTLTVSFHWQLITQPPDLVDYVVVHELAHLHEPNHGAGVLAARGGRAARLQGAPQAALPARRPAGVLTRGRRLATPASARRQKRQPRRGRTSARRFTSMPAR